MTAVEWLVDQMRQRKEQGLTLSFYDLEMFAEKAKEMEKEQMLNAFQESRLTHPMIGFKHETFVDYYKQTFKSE